MDGFTIIHLSDLHIGRRLSGNSLLDLADFTADSLTDDFREIAEEHSIPFRPEETLLVITGDITHQAEWGQYEVATRFLRRLQSQFPKQLQTSELPSEHIICIPGNHDIETPEKEPADTAVQRKTKYRNFKLFFDEITDHSPFARNFTLANPFVNVHIPAPFRIQMLDLNTTLNISCHSKEEAGSRASLTPDHLKTLDTFLKGQDEAFRIAMMHHPLADFPSEDSDSGVSQDSLRDWLISNRFRMVLCGHAHSAVGKRVVPYHEETIREENGLLVLVTGYSCLLGRPLDRGNHYQIIRMQPSDNDRIALLQRKYVYAREPHFLDREAGHWEPEDRHYEILTPKVSSLMDIIGATDYKRFIGIRGAQDWTVVAHCDSSKFQAFGVLSPGEQVNANLLEISGFIEGHLARVDKTTKIEWEKYSGKSALFLVDSPYFNPYVRSILKSYGTYLAGGAVQFIHEREEKPILERIQIHLENLTANKGENMKLFDEFTDYLLLMRLPSFVPRTGDANVEMSDIDKNRVIWIVAGIHSKASYAGAMIFTPRNLQLFATSLREKFGGQIPEYFEAVYKAPNKPARIDSFKHLELVHFKILRLKSEVGLADDLPSGAAARFLNRSRWDTIPINTVHLDPVAACNFKCPTCIEKDMREKNLFLSMSTCASILCDLREIGCQNLNLYGGEPTLHPDFDTILRLSSNLGFDIFLATNGSRLGEKGIAKAIVNARNRIHVRVSIDAHSAESHQNNHGLSHKSDYFKSIVDNTQQLIRQGVSVTVSFLLHRDSISEIEEACSCWREKCASALILRPLTEQLGKSPEFEYREDEKNRIRRAINDPEGFVFTPAWFQNWINMNEDKPPQEQERTYDICYSGYYRMAISPCNGTGSSQKVRVEGLEITETSNAWMSLCTYRRYHPAYGCKYPQDLNAWCQIDRQKTLESIKPSAQCKGIICCRHGYNKQIQDLLSGSVSV